MDKTKKKNNRLYFFFSLVCTLLLSACGVKNYHGFFGEDARFANYTLLGTDGDGSTGLAYYADDTNPNEIAVAIGSCVEDEIEVTTYKGRPVTSVFPAGFQNCDTIKTITLPETITSFGTDAFAGSALQYITIPNGLSVISSGAFRNCKDLVVVEFDKVNNSVTTINDYAFANDYSLSTFAFHNLPHLKTIGSEAFLYCLELRSVIFPKGFTTLHSYAFQDCKGLTTIYFPASTAYVATNAFRGVGESAKIYFSEEEPGSISSSSASTSSSRTPVSLADNFNFSYGNYYIPVMYGVGDLIISGPFHFSRPENGRYPLEEYTGTGDGTWRDENRAEYTEIIAEDEVILYNYEDDGRTSLDIPSTIVWGETLKVVGIQNNVFKDKTTFSSVTFHENLRFIDAFAFQGCTSLDKIDLQGAIDLKHIQAGAFYNTMPTKKVYDAEHKNEIHIPATVENIGPGAFGSCDGLFKLHFDGASNTYEETFYSPGGTDSFELPYEPTSVSSVTVDGPTKTYAVNDKTIQISGGNVRLGAVIKAKYETNSTNATQRFVGHLDGDNLASEFVLYGIAERIESITVGGVAQVLDTDYTVENIEIEEETKTKITFTTPPVKDGQIVVSYRLRSRLKKIDEYAFYGCADGFSGSKFNSYNYHLRQCVDPFPSVTFPASLTEIGANAFNKAEFIGEAVIKSSSLSIGSSAFQEHKCLSSIIFPTNMTNLVLNNKSFASGLSIEECSTGSLQKKLISVTLPAATTVKGDDVFWGHSMLSIYCIGNTPTIQNKANNWNRIGSQIPARFGDFKTAQTTIDKAPTYKVSSANDIVTLPDKDHPVFDFVKEIGNTYATLTNYHYYGARIMDRAGNTAIVPGKSLTTYDTSTFNTNYKNVNYSSQYAVMLSNGHFRAEVPAQVKINGSFIDVKKIGQSALAMQINETSMRPNTKSRTGTNFSDLSECKYWIEDSNFWTTREITLPNSIEEIGAASLAFTPFAVIKTYDTANSKLSDDKLSMIWDSAKAISENGYFPSSLTTLGRMACSFSSLTNAKLPNGLTSFNGITNSSGPDDNSWYTFPFIGCFDLEEISLYDAGAAAPVFTSNGSIISYEKNGQMIEGAEGITEMTIPWGTTSITKGALRGGRRISILEFPYTVTNVAPYLMDTIGSAVDSWGWSGTSRLNTVSFKSAAEYGKDDTEKEAHATPSCTVIGESAFWGCTSLANIELPIGLTTIGPKAFRNCSGITNITIDSGTSASSPYTANPVTSLGKDVDLTKLPSLNFIDYEAFAGSSVASLTTSSNIQSLGIDTFRDCKQLAAVTFDGALTTIGNTCFYGCSLLANVTFNGTGVSFGSNCFYNCDALTNIDIPNDSTINSLAFNNCNGLDNGRVLVGTGVSFTGTKGDSAFKDCDAGTKIFLMEDYATYITRKNAGKYPEGWNVRSWNNDSGDALDFYCYSATQPQNPVQGFHYWEDEDHDGVPHIWL